MEGKKQSNFVTPHLMNELASFQIAHPYHLCIGWLFGYFYLMNKIRHLQSHAFTLHTFVAHFIFNIVQFYCYQMLYLELYRLVKTSKSVRIDIYRIAFVIVYTHVLFFLLFWFVQHTIHAYTKQKSHKRAKTHVLNELITNKFFDLPFDVHNLSRVEKTLKCKKVKWK